MNLRLTLASILLATGFTGCATFTDAELGQIRHRGVSPAVVGKMQEGRGLTPPDVIELTRRGVADQLIIRQIEDAGVDYVLNRNDVKKLQAAHVSRPVLDALEAASDDFASRYAPPGRVHAYIGYPGYPYGDYYSGPYPYASPYPYYDPYPYGGVSVELGGGRYYGGHRHWR
jgi:hypothetical protein